jgi:hypothetical protein
MAMVISHTHTHKRTHTHSRGQLGIGDRTIRGDSPGQLGASLPPVNLGTSRYAVTMAAGHEHNCAVLDNKVSHIHARKYVHTYTYICAHSRIHAMLHVYWMLSKQNWTCNTPCNKHVYIRYMSKRTCASHRKPLVLRFFQTCITRCNKHIQPTYMYAFVAIRYICQSPQAFGAAKRIFIYLSGVYNHITHHMLTELEHMTHMSFY